MKKLLFFLILGLFALISMRRTSAPVSQSQTIHDIEPAQWSRSISISGVPPGIFLSRQPAAHELHEFLSLNQVRTIVRLNGSGDDQGPISSQEERDICEQYGVTFIQMNAHEGYEEGRGYVRSVEQIRRHLQNGRALVHCLHGVHRAPTMVAAYLRTIGIEYDTAIQHTGMQDLVRFPGEYYKYVETVFSTEAMPAL